METFNRERYYELFTAVFQEFSILPMTIAENVAQCPAEQIDRARLYKINSSLGEKDRMAFSPYLPSSRKQSRSSRPLTRWMFSAT